MQFVNEIQSGREDILLLCHKPDCSVCWKVEAKFGVLSRTGDIFIFLLPCSHNDNGYMFYISDSFVFWMSSCTFKDRAVNGHSVYNNYQSDIFLMQLTHVAKSICRALRLSQCGKEKQTLKTVQQKDWNELPNAKWRRICQRCGQNSGFSPS